MEKVIAEGQFATVPKMDFDSIDMVFGALFEAFHPDGMEGKECADMRFVSLWTLFLASVGWNEEEYWAEEKKREHLCPKCGCERDDDEDIEMPKPEGGKPPVSKAN